MSNRFRVAFAIACSCGLLHAATVLGPGLSAERSAEFHLGIEYWGGGEYVPGYVEPSIEAETVYVDTTRTRPLIPFAAEGKANNANVIETYPLYAKLFLPLADSVDFYAGVERVSISAPDLNENIAVTEDAVTSTTNDSGFGQFTFRSQKLAWLDQEAGVNIDLGNLELLLFGGQRLITQSAESQLSTISRAGAGSSNELILLTLRQRDFSHKIKNGLYGVGVTVPLSDYVDLYGKLTIAPNGSTEINIESPFSNATYFSGGATFVSGYDFYAATYNLRSTGYELGVRVDAGPGEFHLAYKREDFKSSYDGFAALAQGSLTITSSSSTLNITGIPTGRRISDNVAFGRERKWHVGNVAIGYTFIFGRD